MADNSFTKFVPGFDFLQGLVKNAGAALPGMGQWVAPTLNPEELEKRIEELRTVQFWLEQNARMLGATIQALEVQRMTLSTLKSMNVPLTELRDSLKVATPKAQAEPEPEPEEQPAAAPAAVDPMQWWSALSQQFTQLATTAMKDSATDAAKNLAGTLVKQSFEAAGETLRKTAAMPGALARKAATQAATRPAAKKKAAAKPAARPRKP
ncbi:PhaM family polyhydroxyalkanoate granule multifunctional regulatory protein [Roseateles cavernae]|uniref:PhaM family polyhydroxyalkanoate granule multifunctional regulatory protein n=1 Tax=Roseateles cavernae TaxID=3153578 RepID=UPI0032E4A182